MLTAAEPWWVGLSSDDLDEFIVWYLDDLYTRHVAASAVDGPPEPRLGFEHGEA